MSDAPGHGEGVNEKDDYDGKVSGGQTVHIFIGNGLHLDHFGARVNYARHLHLLAREFSRCRLIAQSVGVVVPVIQNKHRAMSINAGQRATGIRRPHSHLRMVGFRAYAVGYGARKGLFLRGRDCRHRKNGYDKTAADDRTRDKAHGFHS